MCSTVGDGGSVDNGGSDDDALRADDNREDRQRCGLYRSVDFDVK